MFIALLSPSTGDNVKSNLHSNCESKTGTWMPQGGVNSHAIRVANNDSGDSWIFDMVFEKVEVWEMGTQQGQDVVEYTLQSCHFLQGC